MARSSLPRSLCMALVLLLLSSSLFAAGGRATHPAAKRQVSLASRLWTGFTALIGSLGSEMDPDGKAKSSALTGNLGSSMDPNGKPQSTTATGDLGASMDPDGRK